MILWLELPEGFVVGNRVIDPEEPPVSFASTLIDATSSPMVGPPRRPARARVADARLAAELRAALPELQVVVAPTPELDEVLAHMASAMPGDPEDGELSYFEGGRVPEEAVEALFRAAQLLHRIAPWRVADDGQVLRLDVPQLGVNGACVSIIGALGESFGVILFPSLEAFERFRELAQAGALSADGPIDLGTSILSLNFKRATDLPPSLRREAAEHAWPVHGALRGGASLRGQRSGRQATEDDAEAKEAVTISHGGRLDHGLSLFVRCCSASFRSRARPIRMASTSARSS